MKPASQRALGLVLVSVGLLGVVVMVAVRPGAAPRYRGSMMGPPFSAPSPTCSVPPLPGQVVDVALAEVGMMGGGNMMGGSSMSVTASISSVDAGTVSFLVRNVGSLTHEFVVLPLLKGEAGTRAIGSDGGVSESGIIAEASNTCGEGAGEGITPGTSSWVTVDLAAGRYELICNLPGHYAAGMFTELDVR